MKKSFTSELTPTQIEEILNADHKMEQPRNVVVKNIMDYVRSTKVVESETFGNIQTFQN